jgi:hypothetical protein
MKNIAILLTLSILGAIHLSQAVGGDLFQLLHLRQF